MNSDYHHHKFKDNFNETAKTNGKDSQSERLIFIVLDLFHMQLLISFFSSFFMIFSHPFFIKDSLHYIDFFRSS